ncbi:MAG: peptidylprolyl isomerase [Christensenellales bacterium]
MQKIQIVLSDGRVMNAELYEDVAPVTVENFLKLIDKDFFAGLIFHRVIEDFMIQGGGMDVAFNPKSASAIKGEFKSNGFDNPLKHTKGVLSMARTNMPNSASSQFFICVADTPFLDGEYAAFGRLSDEDSINVAVEISQVHTVSVGYYDDVPYEPIVIKTIKRA